MLPWLTIKDHFLCTLHARLGVGNIDTVKYSVKANESGVSSANYVFLNSIKINPVQRVSLSVLIQCSTNASDAV